MFSGRSLTLALIGGALYLAPLASAQQQAALALTVTDTAVEATNVTPGGTVVLIYCAKGSRESRTYTQRNALVLRDDDRDGRVRYQPPEPVPLASVWVAVDGSGAVAAAAHPRFSLSWNALPSGAFRKDAENEIAFIEQDLPRLSLFLVRPDAGGSPSVWEILARDGTASDRDGSPNGRLKLAFEDARTIEGREKAPKHAKKGDVIVAFDPGHLEVFTAQVGK